ncbi:MAG TPA: efflux RND transporter periplasmic adaptor subunit [Gemmatimonadales bacterium]
MRQIRFVPAALVIALVGCAPSEGAPADQEEAVRVVNVEVTPVEATGFTDFIRITGQVAAMHDMTLSAEETGVVRRFLVEKGAPLEAGQVIAELDAEVLAAQVAEARATANLASDEHERRRRLWQDEQVGSELAYLQTKSAAEAAAARLRNVEARLARTKIRAPVAGVFDEQLIELGEMAMPGSPVARVVSVGQVKIVGGIPERYALAVRPGSATIVSLDVLPEREFHGRVAHIGASVEGTNRTVPMEVVMANPGNLLKPGMIASVQVVREQRDSVIVVPQQVVQRTEDGYQVYVVVDREGRTVAEARPVRLGPSYRNRVVIVAGLSLGERLITLGQQLVDPGSRVRIVDTHTPADAALDARKDTP